jgi:hypothetical protein
MLCGMEKHLRKALAHIGRKGGKAGRGVSKQRGDSGYYQALSRKGVKARAHKRKES